MRLNFSCRWKSFIWRVSLGLGFGSAWSIIIECLRDSENWEKQCNVSGRQLDCANIWLQRLILLRCDYEMLVMRHATQIIVPLLFWAKAVHCSTLISSTFALSVNVQASFFFFFWPFFKKKTILQDQCNSLAKVLFFFFNYIKSEYLSTKNK